MCFSGRAGGEVLLVLAAQRAVLCGITQWQCDFRVRIFSLSKLLYLRISVGVMYLQLVWFTSVEPYWLTCDSYVQEMMGRGPGSYCLIGKIFLIFSPLYIGSFSSTKSHCLDKFSIVSSGWIFPYQRSGQHRSCGSGNSLLLHHDILAMSY